MRIRFQDEEVMGFRFRLRLQLSNIDNMIMPGIVSRDGLSTETIGV
jgi:hypothetical protein